MSKRKSRQPLCIALPAILLILGGVAAEVRSILCGDLWGLLIGWAVALCGHGLIVHFTRNASGDGLPSARARIATAAVDTFLYGTGIGALLTLLGGAFVSFEKQGITGTWWIWGFGAALAFLVLWTILNRWKRESQKRRARTLGNLVALGLLVVLVGIILGSFDIKPSRDKNRSSSNPPHPRDADNAYQICLSATNAVSTIPPRPLKDITAEEADQIVASNAVVLAKLHQAANCPSWDDAEADSPARYRIFPVAPVARLHKLELIKIKADLEHGRIRDALQTARDLALHARLMLDHAETVLTWLCGIRVRQCADDALMVLLASKKTTDDDLAEMREILSLTESLESWNWTRLGQSECRQFSSLISGMAKNRSLGGRLKTDSVLGRYLFHPERTRVAASRLLEHYLPVLNRPGYEKKTWDEADQAAQQIMDATLKRTGFPGQNIFGSLLLATLGTNWRTVGLLTAQSDFSHVAARLALALESFRRRTGALPNTLDELVPAFLDVVPQDPFARPNPLNYDPKQGILWSVGKNKTCTGFKTRSRSAPYGPGNSKYVRRIDGTPIP